MVFIGIILAGVGVSAVLALQAFRENLLYFFSPSQVAAGKAPPDRFHSVCSHPVIAIKSPVIIYSLQEGDIAVPIHQMNTRDVLNFFDSIAIFFSQIVLISHSPPG